MTSQPAKPSPEALHAEIDALHERQIAHRHREQLAIGDGAVYLDVSIFPLQTNDSNGIMFRIDDVIQRIQLKEMMLQAAKMVRVGGLSTGIAHEINSPLSGMIQSAQVLQPAFNTRHVRTRERLQIFGEE